MGNLKDFLFRKREWIAAAALLCAVCLLPVCAAGWLCVQRICRMAEAEELARGRDTAAFLAGAFGKQMESLNDQANQLSLNRRLVPQVNEAIGVPDDLETIDELNNVNAAMALTSITGIYFRQTETVFTSQYKYTLAQYIDVFSNGDAELAAFMENMFRTLDARGWSAVSVDGAEGAGMWSAMSGGSSYGGRRIVVAVPVIVRGDLGYDAVVFFVLTESDLGRYFQSLCGEETCGFAILDPSGRRVYADHEIFEEFADEELAQGGEDGVIDTGSGKIYRHTDKNGAMYLVYPEHQTGAASVGRRTRAVLLCVFAASLLLLAAAVCFLFRPLERLARRADGPDVPKGSAVAKLSFVLERREAVLRRQETLLMPRILDALVRGRLKDAESLRYFEEQTAGKQMQAVAVRIEGCVEAACGNPLPDTLEADGTRLRVHACTPVLPCGYLFVCILESGDLGAAAGMIGDMLWRVRRERAVTASGDTASDAASLMRSCADAVRRVLRDEEPAVLSEEYPAEELKTLYEYIRAGDNRGAQTTLRDIFDSPCMKGGDSSAKFLLYEFAIGYLGLLRALNCVPAADDVRALLDAAAEYADPSLNYTVFAASVRASCAQIARTNRNESSKLRWEILEYVGAHITDPELSCQRAADAFGISIYTFSRLFKDAAGMGFKEYINERRMTLARRYLVAGTDSIGQIAAACGFDNATYFAKLFKTATGLTPSAYRAENATPGAENEETLRV